AYTAVDNAEDDEQNAAAVNKRLPEMLAVVLKDLPVYLIHYSTDFVFSGRQRNLPYTEKDNTEPLSVYGATKLAGEQALSKLDNCAVLRTAWLFGEGRKNFVSTILKFAQERDTLRVVADQFGSPTYARDLAEMSFLIMKNHGVGLFHAVNSGQASWCDLASEAVKLFNLPTFVEPIETKDWVQKAVRPKYSVLSTQKLQQLYGYVPRPWTQALQEYIFENMETLKIR
ncbi:MAG: NAD(P)-dependent oxidoreductase, partial [Mailhella sp.]|nr:NAD(P)-dependent oxidoreductase [Mailhella sp.]